MEKLTQNQMVQSGNTAQLFEIGPNKAGIGLIFLIPACDDIWLIAQEKGVWQKAKPVLSVAMTVLEGVQVCAPSVYLKGTKKPAQGGTMLRIEAEGFLMVRRTASVRYAVVNMSIANGTTSVAAGCVPSAEK
jgi:hypothetical protein